MVMYASNPDWEASASLNVFVLYLITASAINLLTTDTLGEFKLQRANTRVLAIKKAKGSLLNT